MYISTYTLTQATQPLTYRHNTYTVYGKILEGTKLANDAKLICQSFPHQLILINTVKLLKISAKGSPIHLLLFASSLTIHKMFTPPIFSHVRYGAYKENSRCRPQQTRTNSLINRVGQLHSQLQKHWHNWKGKKTKRTQRECYQHWFIFKLKYLMEDQQSTVTTVSRKSFTTENLAAFTQ